MSGEAEKRSQSYSEILDQHLDQLSTGTSVVCAQLTQRDIYYRFSLVFLINNGDDCQCNSGPNALSSDLWQ
jgi:hypothetical protein